MHASSMSWHCKNPLLTQLLNPGWLKVSNLLSFCVGPAASGSSVNMEAAFSQLTLDVIGKAVFNYNFNSLTQDSPLIQVRQWL
jgi:hypothetical protein